MEKSYQTSRLCGCQEWPRHGKTSEAHKIDSISMADGIRMLIQGENDMRMSNRTHRLIKNAHFRYTVALDEIAADSACGIDQSLLNAADAILDRVVNTASRFALKGDSLRIKQ